jgi:hypothetical protein
MKNSQGCCFYITLKKSFQSCGDFTKNTVIIKFSASFSAELERLVVLILKFIVTVKDLELCHTYQTHDIYILSFKPTGLRPTTITKKSSIYQGVPAFRLPICQ